MKIDPYPKDSTGLIRRRLFTLLLQAYLVVLILSIILLVSAIAYLAIRTTSTEVAYRPRLSSILERYYRAQGSWDNVGIFFQSASGNPHEPFLDEWRDAVLLDSNQKVIFDRGIPASGKTDILLPANESARAVLRVDGVNVGVLILEQPQDQIPWRLVEGMFIPFGVIVSLLTFLTLVIGLLLTRRVVNPLSEVISAVQMVTAGNLKTRVSVQGPDDLRALSDGFNQMASTLEKNENERRAMLTDIAHELRTPLTIMRGRLEAIVDGIYPPDEAHFSSILEETYLLERLVEDLRDLALAESRQIHFNFEAVNLNNLVEQAVSFYEAEANESGITLSAQTCPDMPLVTADAQRTKQVISNLLSNALRYTTSGGAISVEVSHAGDEVVTKIMDTGPGVAEEDLPHIFDRFWRGEKSRSRATGGAGLGLAIARHLILNQNGKIWAQNRQGGGFEAGFSLPVATGQGIKS